MHRRPRQAHAAASSSCPCCRSIYGLCIDDKKLPPAAEALLDDRELHLYQTTNKARALVYQKLQQITVSARITGEQVGGRGRQRGQAAAFAGDANRAGLPCRPLTRATPADPPPHPPTHPPPTHPPTHLCRLR